MTARCVGALSRGEVDFDPADTRVAKVVAQLEAFEGPCHTLETSGRDCTPVQQAALLAVLPGLDLSGWRMAETPLFRVRSVVGYHLALALLRYCPSPARLLIFSRVIRYLPVDWPRAWAGKCQHMVLVVRRHGISETRACLEAWPTPLAYLCVSAYSARKPYASFEASPVLQRSLRLLDDNRAMRCASPVPRAPRLNGEALLRAPRAVQDLVRLRKARPTHYRLRLVLAALTRLPESDINRIELHVRSAGVG